MGKESRVVGTKYSPPLIPSQTANWQDVSFLKRATHPQHQWFDWAEEMSHLCNRDFPALCDLKATLKFGSVVECGVGACC